MADHHTKGHRKRMRERLLTKGAETLTELEILEMLLFAGQPRGDTKPLAKILIRQFGSLAAVLRAPVQQLSDQRSLGDASISALKLVEAAGLHLAHSDIHNRPVLTSWGAVKHYCINRLAHEPIEYLIMLCLDNRNRLIAEETLSKGTVDQTAVYVREVINAALKHHAQAVILVHNHPSGETTPSPADAKMTDELQRALGLMTIDLHDHLIVAGTQCISFKSLGHL
jgi:DNA repair protein RadC